MYNDNFKINYTTTPIAYSEMCFAADTPAHIHSELEMLYISSGKATVNINNKCFSAESGDIFFINPLEVHKITADTDSYKNKCICFESSLITDTAFRNCIDEEYVKIMSYFPNNSPHCENIKNIFMKLFNATVTSDKTLFLESIAYVSELFVYFIKNNLFEQNNSRSENKLFYKQTIKYLENNYNFNISSKNASDALGYTQSYFCRRFKKCFGTNFSAYLNIYRISVSKKLLENPSASVNDVACRCGFTSPSYFTHCFKKHIGMLPSEYQKCQYL